MNYTEIKFVLKNDDVVIQPTKNKIEANNNMTIEKIDFQKEKEKIKTKLAKEKSETGFDLGETTNTIYRKRR